MTKPPTKRLAAADRRRDMIEAARVVFLRQGYTGARTRDIAEASGVSEAIIYRHFESKEDLFEAAVLLPLEEHLAVFSAWTNDFAMVTNEERRARSLHIHEHAFGVMSEIVPLLGVAIFADGESSRRFYRRRIAPLIDRGATVMGHSLESWPGLTMDPGFLFKTVFGSYLVITLDAAMRGDKVDSAAMALQLTDLLSAALAGSVPGAGRARTPAVSVTESSPVAASAKTVRARTTAKRSRPGPKVEGSADKSAATRSHSSSTSPGV